MYVAMNRFQVVKGEERAFEEVWLGRDIYLNDVSGFIEFHLVRGPADDAHTLYATHTIWASETAFRDWTRSDAFRAAHKNAGDHKHLYAGPPVFEGFEVLQTVKPS